MIPHRTSSPPPAARAANPPRARLVHHLPVVAPGLLVTLGAVVLGYALAAAGFGFYFDAGMGAAVTATLWAGAIALCGARRRREARAIGSDLAWLEATRERRAAMVSQVIHRPAAALTVIRGGKDPGVRS